VSCCNLWGFLRRLVWRGQFDLTSSAEVLDFRPQLRHVLKRREFARFTAEDERYGEQADSLEEKQRRGRGRPWAAVSNFWGPLPQRNLKKTLFCHAMICTFRLLSQLEMLTPGDQLVARMSLREVRSASIVSRRGG